MNLRQTAARLSDAPLIVTRHKRRTEESRLKRRGVARYDPEVSSSLCETPQRVLFAESGSGARRFSQEVRRGLHAWVAQWAAAAAEQWRGQ